MLSRGTLSTVDPFLETNPDAFGSFFSSASTVDGFGPGDYSGGYTGANDRVYWGPFGDGSKEIVKPPPAASKTHPRLDTGTPNFGPGFAVDKTLEASGKNMNVSETFPQLGTTDAHGHELSQASQSSQSQPASTSYASDTQIMDQQSFSVAPSGQAGVDQLPGDPVVPGSIEMQDLGGAASSAPMSDGVFSRAAGKPGVTGDIVEDITENIARNQGAIELQPLVRHTAHTDTEISGGAQSDVVSGSIEMQPMGSAPTDYGSVVSRFDPTSTYDGDSYAPSAPFEDEDALEEKAAAVEQLDAAEPEWRGSLGGIDTAELPDLPMDSPFMLHETPPSAADFDISKAIDWESMPPEAKSAFSDYFSSEASTDNSFLSAEGIGQEAGLLSSTGFSNFVEARLKDLGIGTLLAPYFMWLDRATGTPWVGRGIQGTMALAGLALAGDPFGVIAAPICWMAQEISKQNMRGER